MPKYVASRSRTEVGCSGTVLRGALGEAVAALKAEGDADQTLLLPVAVRSSVSCWAGGLVDERACSCTPSFWARARPCSAPWTARP